MRIKDIQIDGFGVWTGLSVASLPDTMTVFYGPNEAGKTTLMQYIRASLYGFSPERRKRYLPPVHGGNPGGAMRITGPGGGYELTRRAVMTDTTAVGSLTITGSDGLSQGQHRLNTLLGNVDEAIFTNVFAIGLRELQELNTLDDTAAADELYKLSSGLDRVSLVEVIRRLRGARENLVGTDPDDPADGRVAELLIRRDKLRGEVDTLSRRGRRWAELATQRRAQTGEIETLRQRLGEWQLEAKTAELALNLRDTWQKRARLAEEVESVGRGLELPDSAPVKLKEYDQKLAERRAQLDEIKNRRRQLREEAESLPVSKRLLELQPKIDAANQQSPWIEEAQNQLHRVEGQIEQARKALLEEAQRANISEEDRQALAEGKDTLQLPELSRQSLTALAGPAKAVRENLFRMKQARDEGMEGKREADRLSEKIRLALKGTSASDLSVAIREQGEFISIFRRRSQLEDHLEKLRRHVRDLEREAVDLTTARALPIDRTILLAAPFFLGGVMTLYGFFHILDIFVVTPDPAWGTLVSICGLAILLVYWVGRKLSDRNTDTDLDDCDRQLEVARKQLKELERDKHEIESQLPAGTGTVEARLRDAEEKLVELEGLLPTFHTQQAALQRYKNAKQRSSESADALKAARSQWRRTLESMGLDETLTPTAVKQLSRGFESLQAAQRRLTGLLTEREQRRRELNALGQRVDTLYRQAFTEAKVERVEEEVKPSRANLTSAKVTSKGDKKGDSSREVPSVRPVTVRADREDPLSQLQQLNEEIARQQHWIDRRKELKENDSQLKKQQLIVQRHVERYEQMRRSLLARCGVEDDQGFNELVSRKARLARLKTEHQDVDQQLRTAIGQKMSYDDIARELDSPKAHELERRWESLVEKISQTDSRISQLLSKQGELAQEMRQQAGDMRLSIAQLELGAVDQQLANCVKQWQTLATTSQLLDEVCRTFEKERQPETLREASSFLSQLTDGKYRRIWTPLGTNALKVENERRESLSLELLSRGTREAVFIALRLALASAYARRGVMLPLILDDVLVNFDRTRALHAARTLRQFAELGHQVLMFTCHQHIVDIFHEIGVEVRSLPDQGRPGIAEILYPPEKEWVEEEVLEEEEEEEFETPAVAEIEYEPEPPVIEPVPTAVVEEEIEAEAEEEEDVEEEMPVPAPPLPIVQAPPPPEPVRIKPVYIVERPIRIKRERPAPPRLPEEPAPAPIIDWMWYDENTPIEGWFDDPDPADAPAEVFDAWWDRPATAK